MKNKYKIIIIAAILVSCIISATLGYVFLLSPQTKYPDNPGDANSPIKVDVQVSENVISILNSTEDKIASAISGACKMWSMFSTRSRLNVAYFGKGGPSVPFSYDDIGCAQLQPDDVQNQDNQSSIVIDIKNNIVATGTIDPDCTGPACAHIWSCERSGDRDEIQRFDIQLNVVDFTILAENADAGSYDLKTLIAHHIGHAVGLTHCTAGDTVESCRSRLSGDMFDPAQDAVMYKKIIPGAVLSDTSDDDRNGIIALYGRLSDEKLAMQNVMQRFIQTAESGCPCLLPQEETDSRYALSSNETQALAEYNQTLTDKGLNTVEKRKEFARYYQDLHLTAYTKLSVPAEIYLINGMNNMPTLFPQIPVERLHAMRQVIVANIQEKKSMLDDFRYELDPRFYDFTLAELKALIQIRKAIIDEIARR